MKKLVTTTALLMLLTTSIASAQDRTQEYRMWSAEQMINRITDKLVRWRKACDQAEYAVGQRLSEKCITGVLNTYPLLGKLREAAASGDDVLWAKVIDIVHEFEAGIEAPLNTLERGAR